MTEARPGEWVVISGVGGLGHIAIQYAKAMGLHVAAVDLGPEKMALARNLGAEITIDAKTGDPTKQKSRNKSAGRTEHWSRRFHQSPSSKRSACFVAVGLAS